MIIVVKYIKHTCKEDGTKLFFMSSVIRTRSNRLKLDQGRFKVDNRQGIR